MHVLFSAAVIACPLQTTYCHGSDSLIRDTKTVHSKEDEGKLQSWTKVGILLNFWGVFQFTHTLPLPSPHKQRWTHVSRIFSTLFLKDRVLICGDGIKRSILAQYIIPYFKADISLFPTADRLTQISLYISLLHHDLQNTVAKLKIKKPSAYLLHLFTSTNVTISNLPGVNWQDNRNKIRQNYGLR